MKNVKIVIAHRMGKGQNVAKGVEAAGGTAIVVPGIGADMKLGDVMKTEEADLGISFCGGGGGGAMAAQNKYGFKAIYDMRSIQAGVNAVKNGYEALGFGFMDTEELGKAITEAYIKYRM
ncbi:MAG TPA: glycine-rich SFCGS family protein [Candidatus Lachnoclostridium pullistercoris]|uniref:Glycine-rich SFCGS family protein n=1 Tax=Candidatus Lachnoclostridium pullistercoris TaxID=2838632 RepID=A0A9D2PCU8_9FIRM|nr:glycine-rich SFCGS family protein [Candidatus Lachnoclostridium pullistercoris]